MIALRVEHLEGSIVHVRQNLWNDQLGLPKTVAGTRDVDLPSLLAAALNHYLGERKTGYVFQNEAGGPLHQSNVLRRSLHPILSALELEK